MARAQRIVVVTRTAGIATSVASTPVAASASDATIAMELGADAVLVNTAIAASRDPVAMAGAFKLAVEAGRIAREAGRMRPRLNLSASASSPEVGLIGLS